MPELYRPTEAEVEHYEKVIKPELEKAREEPSPPPITETKPPKAKPPREEEPPAPPITVTKPPGPVDRKPTPELYKPTPEEIVRYEKEIKPQIVGVFPTFPEGTKSRDWVGVASSWAESHPEEVIRVGDKYYRPAIGAGEDIDRALKRAQLTGETAAVGAVPEKGQLIVKDIRTGLMYTVASTKAVAELTARMIELEEVGVASREDGQYQIDIAAALSYGVTETELKDWGFTKEQIDRAVEGREEYWQAQKVYAELKRTHIGPLPDDKWILISDWNRLDPEYQSIALKQGWGAAQEAWSRDRVRLPDGTWMLKSDVEHVKGTMPEAHKVLMSEGFDAYSALFVDVGRDEYMLREDYDALSGKYQGIVDDKGVTGLQEYIETGILGTTISRLDEIASPDFFRLGGSVSERIALEGAMRRADIEYPGVVTYKGLSDADKQRVAGNYIPPEGFGIASEAEYELKKLREKLADWSISETPVGITTVKQLDEITSQDFTKLGWGASDRIALENTMRRLGIKDPGTSTYRRLSPEEKQEVADSFTYETLAVDMLKPIEERTTKAVEDITNWVTEDPNAARKIVKGIPAGLAEIVLGVTVGVGGAVLKSVNELAVQRPRTALVQLSNVPLGAAEWLTVQTPKRVEQDPAAGISLFVGNLCLPFIVPGIKGAVGGVKSGYNIAQTFYREGALPRGLKGGGLDVYRVKVPEGFERLTTELDVIARDKAQVRAIFESGLSKEQQMVRVRELLTPETRVVYDNYMKLVDEVSRFKVPEGMIREVDFADIARMPKESAEAVKAWMQENIGDVKVHGSLADWVQTKGVEGMWRPNDVDLNIMPKSKLTPELAARQLAETVKETSRAEVRARGGSVEIFKDGKWTKLIDVHWEGEFGKLPYEWTPKAPVKIEGILFEQLGEQMFRRGEQIVNPGVGRARGLMGPEAAERPWRLKDVHRLQTEVRGIIDTLREQGKVEVASRLEGALDFIEKAPRGEPIPLTPERSATLQREFIDLVADLQEMALDRGIDVLVSHRLGTLHRYITPQGKVLRGTVYHATRDIDAYVRTLKEKGYIEAGRYIDERGRWVEAPREDLFTSPDLAFDRLYDFYKGKIPKEAGVVAIRTVAGDVGRGRAVDPAFRTEYVTEVGKEPRPVVYDELIFGGRAYPTDPTGFSFRKGSVSEGLTGELATYHPRAKVPVNVIFFATEGARRAGLGAPSAAQIHSMNLMAIKAVIGDLWHPRFPERFVATTEPIKGAALIEFRRDTYKWRGRPKDEVAKAVAEQDKILRTEAVENLRKKGEDRLSPEEYAKALDGELARVSSKKVLDALSDKDIQRMLKDITADEITRTYYLNLKEIYSKIAAVGLGAAGTTDITKVMDADITTLPSFASRIEAVTLSPLPLATAAVTPITPTEVPTLTTVPLPEPTPPTAVVTPEITEPTPVTTPVTPTTLPVTPVTEVVAVTEIVTPVTPIKLVTPVTPIIPVTPTVLLPLPEVIEEKRIRVPPGSITWRQGFVWKYIPPPWDQPKPLTLSAPPVGATILGRTPAETVQIIGKPKAKVPREISVDLGIADIYITEYGTRIEYKGRGLETIVGERIMVPEKGMSIPVMEPAETNGIGVQGLKLGTSFAEFVRRTPEDEAQKAFLDREIARMMAEMTPAQIVDEIRLAGLTEPRYEVPGEGKGKGLGVDVNKLRMNELLKHLPDRARAEVKRLLREGETEFVSVGGGRFAELRPAWRRTKPVKAKRHKESEKKRKIIAPPGLTRLA